jgi:hypothetical protein
MATATSGKRKASKAALRRPGASGRQRLQSKARAAFPAGARKTRREIKELVPRAGS